jgi:isopenicillin N synthase-like dioxygenase
MVAYTQPRVINIPLIDLTRSFSSGPAERTAVAREIGTACRDVGFFYVRNHNVPAQLIEAVFIASSGFFVRPIEEKMQCHVVKSEARRGYEPQGNQALDPDSPVDIKESFLLGIDRGPDHPLVRARTPRHGPNVWPSDVDELRRSAETYFQSLMSLSRHLMHLIALSLDLPEGFFDAHFSDPNVSLRLLHYAPHPKDARANQLGAGAHTDWGAITVLAQDDCGGLEVQTTAGNWVRAEPIEGAFVVNTGDLLSHWTNDLYRSTPHRVLNNVSGRDRYSVAFFYDPDYHARIECLASCHTESNPPRYAPCSAGEHNHQMYCRSRGIPYVPVATP